MSEMLENLQLIHEQTSQFQHIRIYEWQGKLIFSISEASEKARTYVQYVEGEDEQIYHNNLIQHALRLNPKAEKFLILGGGDGLAARTLRKIVPRPINITLVDLDREIVELHKTMPRLLELNEGALSFCDIHYEDALQWVPKCHEQFDMIILDFPDPNSKELEPLYSTEFFRQVINLLTDRGSISIQTEWDNSKEVAKNLKQALGNAKIMEYEMPFLKDACIIIGRKTNSLWTRWLIR